jgi:small basic protein (TIGR04137 family)
MSLDKSLKGQDTLMRHRNVLTRAERIERLKETGRWTEDSKAVGLPKVAHRKAAVGKKDKAEKKQQTEASEETATKEEEK